MTYLESIEYENELIPDSELENALAKASRHIDILTYNRIVVCGFDKLTPYQQRIVKEVCKQLAEFEYENAEVLSNILQSYSINGVSMSFSGGWNVTVQGGVAIRRDIYELLCTTGLCYRGIR
ncbi:MAG: hypothetical protein UD936_04025 [Acutalibacteraceae bacterium]|nr:hypothetical protein [Acutalibacteraceae bacterium]